MRFKRWLKRKAQALLGLTTFQSDFLESTRTQTENIVAHGNQRTAAVMARLTDISGRVKKHDPVLRGLLDQIAELTATCRAFSSCITTQQKLIDQVLSPLCGPSPDSADTQSVLVLEGTPYSKYLMPLDYPPSMDFRPRWGNSRPVHEGISRLFERSKFNYARIIDEIRDIKDRLSAIKKNFEADVTLEPGWIGGPITALDLSILYYFVSHYKPATYLEIGSGVTTCFAHRAIQDYALSTKIISVDPRPRLPIDSICASVIRDGLENIDLGIFAELRPGDIVFMDGSHRSFMNSDVTVFMLDVMPLLKPGVIVHFHDIVLPYDYPDSFKSWYWNEQYILATYLLASRESVDVLMPSHYVAMSSELSGFLRPPLLDIGEDDSFYHGGSLWFTHKASPEDERDAAKASASKHLRDAGGQPPRESLRVSVIADKPVALDSPDHVFPWGTRLDNSFCLRFNSKLASWIPPEDLSVLDLGCSGGGFVRTILEMGCNAVGIEGSDYSRTHRRAEWATIPDNLFTADITRPFQVTASAPMGEPAPLRFSLVTAWEVMEHVRADDLPSVFRNIQNHLEPSGVVIFSISPREEVIEGHVLHQTVQGKEWWLRACEDNGFEHHGALLEYFGDDWVRSEPNAPGSFHLVLTRAGESLPHVGRLPPEIRAKLSCSGT